MIAHAKNAEESESYHAQPRSQSVYAVYEIDGIGDAHNENHGSWVPDDGWEVVDAQKAVE